MTFTRDKINYSQDGDGGLTQHTANMAVEPGHDSQADMTWGGPRCEAYVVTADAQVITGPCWVYAVRTTTAGTSSTLDLYDGTSTSGVGIFKSVPTASVNVAGYRSAIAAEGVAVYCADGLYADVGGTGSPSFVVYALAAQP